MTFSQLSNSKMNPISAIDLMVNRIGMDARCSNTLGDYSRIPSTEIRSSGSENVRFS